jgi:hypothetical protein
MRIESGVFGGDDRLPEVRRNVVVPDNEAALDGKIANQLAVRRVDARDRVGVVAVEGRNFRKIAGLGEEHATQNAGHRGHDKQGDEDGVSREANNVMRHGSVYQLSLAEGGRFTVLVGPPCRGGEPRKIE